MNTIYFVNFINLFIGGTIIYYLNHLEKIGCICSLTFQRNYIYYYTLCFFIINVLNIFFHKTPIFHKIRILFMIILLLASIINIVYTIEYVEDMKKQNCKCSESMIRDLMFIIAILKILVYIIFILIVIAILYFKIKMNLPMK
jgi:hypothetical protein